MKRLKTTCDLRRYIADLIRRTEAGTVEPGLAGKLGYLAGILLKCIETSDLEQRMTMLEKTIAEKK